MNAWLTHDCTSCRRGRQSVWIDSLSRDLLQTGELARMIDEDAVVGVTSNPTIFQKAIADGRRLRRAARASSPRATDDPKEIFLAARVDDVRDACDLLRPVWEQTEGVDGYVSIEVDPTLAYDTRGARSSRRCGCTSEVDRPNLFVKIPATEPGPRRRSRR